MQTAEAVRLASRLRHAFGVPRWTEAKLAIYVEALERYPYAPARAIVDRCVSERTESYPPPPGWFCSRIEALIRHAELRRQPGSRSLPPPKDPAVRALLRRTIERLERKASVAASQGGGEESEE